MRKNMGMAGYETDVDMHRKSPYETDRYLPDRKPSTILKLAAGIILFDAFIWFALYWLPAQLG